MTHQSLMTFPLMEKDNYSWMARTSTTGWDRISNTLNLMGQDIYYWMGKDI